MKKSSSVLLTSLFIVAISSCEQKEEWIYGSGRDTLVPGGQYRFYHGYWYPVYNNRIAPAIYNGASYHDISKPGYTPVMAGAGGEGVHSGGFGSSAAEGGGGGGE